MSEWHGAHSPLARTEGPGGVTSPDGKVTLFINEDAYNFYIDARPGYAAEDMRSILQAAARYGLEVFDEDECEPEVLDDGTVRIYACPRVERAESPESATTPDRRLPSNFFAFNPAVAA